jgi:hypothetical protein
MDGFLAMEIYQLYRGVKPNPWDPFWNQKVTDM